MGRLQIEVAPLFQGGDNVQGFWQAIGLGNTGKCLYDNRICVAGVFPLAKAGDGVGNFEIVNADYLVCKKLIVKDENDQLIAYLGSAEGFGSDSSIIKDSDKVVLSLVDSDDVLAPQITLTSSALTFREPNQKILQVGETELSRFARSDIKSADVYGISIFDVKDVSFSILGHSDKHGDHHLVFSNKDGLTLYPKGSK